MATDETSDAPRHDDASEVSLPPRARAVVRRRRMQARQRRITMWQVGVSVLFVVLLAALVFVGYNATLKVGGGTDSRVTDPAAPGYVAEPIPTPLDGYVVTDADGNFATALLIVADNSGEGGTLVALPPSFVVPEVEGSPPLFLRDLYNQDGLDGFKERLGLALGTSLDSVREVPAEAVQELAGGQPVVIDNPEPLVARNEDGTEEVRYPDGEVTIPPEDLVSFLSFEGTNDPAPNQALRSTEVWEQLLTGAKGTSHADLPDGDSSEGPAAPPFGKAVDILNAGDLAFDSVPMAKVPVPDTYYVAWMPDPAELNSFVARVVPVPRSPTPGRRPSVALLNGTTDPGATTTVFPLAVKAGGAVTLVGNASAFDIGTSTVQYMDPSGRAVAEALADELGVTATDGTANGDGSSAGASVPDTDGVAVRVVVGSDQST